MKKLLLLGAGAAAGYLFYRYKQGDDNIISKVIHKAEQSKDSDSHVETDFGDDDDDF